MVSENSRRTTMDGDYDDDGDPTVDNDWPVVSL
jgi:hypothetical protein